MKKEIYPDILSRAIPYVPRQEISETRGRILTDHGWITDEDFALLVDRRLPPYLKTQIHVKTLDNGESWAFYPDGTKSFVHDKNGNRIENAERIPQQPNINPEII